MPYVALPRQQAQGGVAGRLVLRRSRGTGVSCRNRGSSATVAFLLGFRCSSRAEDWRVQSVLDPWQILIRPDHAPGYELLRCFPPFLGRPFTLAIQLAKVLLD